jgi:2'-5' RNA ligase
MARRPYLSGFTDHWTWRPEWTASRPRLLWYLTFEHAPDVAAAALPISETLGACQVDVVPSRWLHLTVTDIGFADEIDDFALAAAAEAVRHAVRGEPALELTLGPVSTLPGAVVLAADPVDRLCRLRRLVRESLRGVGIRPPDDIEGHFRPHVSLAYVNRRTDPARLKTAVAGSAAREAMIKVRCDRVEQVLVTRSDGHYRWALLDQARLVGAPAAIGAQRVR